MNQKQHKEPPCQIEQARITVSRHDAGEVVCRAKFELAQAILQKRDRETA